MQSEKQANIAAMRAIMGNPKLSRILEDGFNSPTGSTKREKAKSIMSIIRKAGSDKAPQTKINDLLEHANKINGAKNSYKKLYEGAFPKDGKGGPMSTAYPSSNTSSPYGIGSPYNILNRAPSTSKAKNYTYNPASYPASEVLGDLSKKVGVLPSDNIFGKAARSMAGLTGEQKSVGQVSPFVDPTYYGTAGVTTPAHIKGGLLSGFSIPKKTVPGAATPEVADPSADPSVLGAEGEYYDPSSFYGDSDFGQYFVGDNPLAGTIYEDKWDQLPKNIQDSLKSSLAGGIFATTTMADREKLRALFPGLSPEQIPWGAGLQGQIDDVRSRLKEEYQLDKIANEREQLIKSGATLFNDLTDYVRGRDTFIKSVDGMMDSVKNNMFTGAGDPASIKANNMYMDYLTVLKGRQNKRYVELLNTSVDNYNKKIEHVTNEYNSKFDAYKNDLALDSEITIGQYTQMFNDLSGMWELVSNAPAMARQAAMEEAEIYALNTKTIKELAELQGSDTNLNFDAVKKYSEHFLGKDGGFKKGTDLYKDLQAALATGDQLNEATITRIFEDAIKSSPDNFTTIKEIREIIAKFKGDGGDELMLEATAYVDPSTGQWTSPYMNPQTGEGNFSDFLLEELGRNVSRVTKGKIDTLTWPAIESAANWLSKYNKDEIGSKRKATKEKFDSGNSNVEENIRNAMWEYYINAINDPTYNKDRDSRRSVFRNTPEDFTSQISRFLSRSY